MPIDDSGDVPHPGFIDFKQVSVRVTRTPNRRRRRMKFFKGGRGVEGGGDLLELGADFSEFFPPLTLIFLVIGAVLLLVFGVPFAIGFLLVSLEFVVLGSLALSASVWAWFRGHPRYAVLTTGGTRWIRAVDADEDARSDAALVRSGTHPTQLAYRSMPYDFRVRTPDATES